MFEEKKQTLKLLGLSPTQAHVYLTLIKSGKSSAKNLAKQSEIACPDIYRIMNIFEKKGLIQKVIEYPKKYKATEIEQALTSLINHKREENKKNIKKIKKLITEMKREQITDKISETDSDLILLPANQVIIKKRKERIQNAKYSIDSVISWKCHRQLLNVNYYALTEKAIEKGVKCRFIIENPNLLENQLLNLINKNGSKIKYTTNIPPALFTIYDKKEATIYTSNTAGLYDTPLLWTNNKSIIAILTGYFEHIWTKTEMQPKITI